MKYYISIIIILLSFRNIYSQEIEASLTNRYNCFEFEAGAIATQNMEISGYHQGNATENWQSKAPTARFEFWNRNNAGWNFGSSVQPLYVKYSDIIKHDLNYRGKVYHEGEKATLVYQFHNMTVSTNYPLLTHDRFTYFRLGGTIIFRYADIYFKGQNDSFHSKNFIVFPLLNTEFSIHMYDRYSFFSRADFLPSPTQNVFLDGLFDVLFAIRTNLSEARTIDIGVRLFFGGYDPQRQDDYANRIFFYGLIARYTF